MDWSSKIKIWDFCTNEVLCTLKPKLKINKIIRGLDKIVIINKRKTLFVQIFNYFLFWNIDYSVQKLKFEGKDSTNSFLQVSPEKSHLFFKPRKESILYKINLRNDMQVEKRVKFPEKIRSFKFVNKGDAMFLHKNRSKTIYT